MGLLRDAKIRFVDKLQYSLWRPMYDSWIENVDIECLGMYNYYNYNYNQDSS